MTQVICPDSASIQPRQSSPAHGARVAAPAQFRCRRAFVGRLARPLESWRAWIERIAEHRRVRTKVLQQVPVADGERVLSIICDAGGEWVVPTERALYHSTGESWSRIGWEQMTHVSWDDARHVLVVAASGPHGRSQWALRLEGAGPLPDLARERMTWTYLLSTKAPVAGHGAAMVTARRQPGTDQTFWQVSADDHVDWTDPAVQSGIQIAIRELDGHIHG